jgi:hypothetical protein
MRITQAYISKSVDDFAFRETYNLTEYLDSEAPCIFFGQYREEDFNAVNNHKGLCVIYWCGMDSKYVENYEIYKKNNVVNITGHIKIKEFLSTKGLDVIKINAYTLNNNDVFSGLYGPKIFAYCPMTAPDYHRLDIIQSLIDMGYPILIGDGSITQDNWHKGIKYDYYNQCYIGLVLNDYAGGGQVILELAMQGKYVISNTKLLNNCLEWNSIDDIVEILERYRFKKPDSTLYEYQQLSNNDPHWLYLNNYNNFTL